MRCPAPNNAGDKPPTIAPAPRLTLGDNNGECANAFLLYARNAAGDDSALKSTSSEPAFAHVICAMMVVNSSCANAVSFIGVQIPSPPGKGEKPCNRSTLDAPNSGSASSCARAIASRSAATVRVRGTSTIIDVPTDVSTRAATADPSPRDIKSRRSM